MNQKAEGTAWTPLHAAAVQEAGECCAVLLESGADPLAEDSFGRRPVDYASVTPEVSGAAWRKTRLGPPPCHTQRDPS